MRRSIPLVLAAATLLVASSGAYATFPGDAGLILFMAETEAGNQLFTMAPDGTGMRQITHVEPEPGPEFPGASRGDWSPDGQTIVFNENGCAMAFIDADGSDLRRAPPEPGGSGGTSICEGVPAFTPDGRSIVYERCEGMTCELWTSNVDGTGRTLVTDACGTVPQVSPDGTRVAWRGCTGLWVANLDGTDARQVTPTDLDVAYKLDWAPDGSVLVFSDGSDDSSPDAINIATVAPDGTGLRYLTDVEAGSHAYVGSYSPDGASIIYRLDRGDEYALFVLAADGSDVQQITEFSAFRPRYLDWGSTPTEAAGTEPEASPVASSIVGEWVGVHDCERIVTMMRDAGLEEFILEQVYGNGLIPGVTDEQGIADPTQPCVGAVPRAHSHFFTADGAFGSRDFDGNQVDDGSYEVVGEDTVLINGASFRYAIDGDSLTLEPEAVDISDCTTMECRFPAAWVLMVAMPGTSWTRGTIEG